MASAFYKSGGFLYISKETNQVLIGRDHSEPATSKDKEIVVPCRASSKVSPDRQQSICISLMDAERPGWYMIHRDGYLYFEQEYAPRNPDTFDKDASFYLTRNHFFPGFSTCESFSRPNHFVHATNDDKIALRVFENTPQFRSAASIYPVRHSYRGESTYSTVALLLPISIIASSVV